MEAFLNSAIFNLFSRCFVNDLFFKYGQTAGAKPHYFG